MASSSIALRPNILPAYARQLGSQRAIADIFGVSLAVVEKRWHRPRTTGEMAPKPQAGGQRLRVDAAAQAQVRRPVHDQPDATLEEWCTRVAETTGLRVSGPTMGRVVRRLG